jgi:heme exporter protein CcmD
MAEFFAMGGFGNFIWGSYGTAVILLVWLGVSSWRKARKVARQLAQLDTDTSAEH